MVIPTAFFLTGPRKIDWDSGVSSQGVGALNLQVFQFKHMELVASGHLPASGGVKRCGAEGFHGSMAVRLLHRCKHAPKHVHLFTRVGPAPSRTERMHFSDTQREVDKTTWQGSGCSGAILAAALQFCRMHQRTGTLKPVLA